MAGAGPRLPAVVRDGLLERTDLTYPQWTALGHRVAAAAVAGFLREQGWVAACPGRR